MNAQVPASTTRGWYPWLNLALSQLAWFAAVWGGAHGHSWPGVTAVAVVVAIDLMVATAVRRTAIRLASALALGVVVDSLLGLSGACTWHGGALEGRLPPLWLMSLWPNFASMLGASLAWLPRRLALAGLLGLVGGPLAYAAGARMHALAFTRGEPIGLSAVGLAWMLAAPLLAWSARPRPTGSATMALTEAVAHG
jgi:hypothetical protein